MLARSAEDAVYQDNSPRFVSAASGHVESYFLRANHPSEPKAIWLKATVLAPIDGQAVAEVWCCVFDGNRGRTWGARRTLSASEASFSGRPLEIEIGECRFVLAADSGMSKGKLTGPDGACSWDLEWTVDPGPLGQPLCMLPFRKMIEAGFPKFKLLTPSPLIRASGSIDFDGEQTDVAGWYGMQGHNWGAEHSYEYAWGQCVFNDAEGEPLCVAEGFTSRIKVGPVLSPRISALVVRRGERTYRFNRIYDLWRQRAELSDLSWVLRMRGTDGEAMLSMRTDASSMVCLGYKNPNGRTSYCFNSKIARTVLHVNPVNEHGFECISEHGGAFEILKPSKDPRFERVI